MATPHLWRVSHRLPPPLGKVVHNVKFDGDAKKGASSLLAGLQ